MTDPVPATTRIDARRLIADIVGAATLEFVQARGRRPFPAEAAKLRREAAQAAFDKLSSAYRGAEMDGVEREQLGILAAAALGGPFEDGR